MSNLTSNGQVTSRDLRQGSVKTLHIIDDAITTPKIPDLAITYPDKIDEPFWVEFYEGQAFFNETITTTMQTFSDGDLLIAPPAWVNQIRIFAVGQFQLTNTSGGDVLMSTAIVVDDGGVQGLRSHTASHNQVQSLTTSTVHAIAGVAGATITVAQGVQVSTGTNTSNNAFLYALAIGTR